ncbi:hypothetical protein TYRP_015750 [Tyrophagus putrescentiae]|nr:hypothetical protein TYRP_015750 [Tyrophagus putrescentiae]
MNSRSSSSSCFEVKDVRRRLLSRLLQEESAAPSAADTGDSFELHVSKATSPAAWWPLLLPASLRRSRQAPSSHPLHLLFVRPRSLTTLDHSGGSSAPVAQVAQYLWPRSPILQGGPSDPSRGRRSLTLLWLAENHNLAMSKRRGLSSSHRCYQKRFSS